MMDQLNQLSALGLEMPSTAYIVGAILFGIVGFVAFSYGKRRDQPRTKWIGLALMLYPYATPQTWLLYLVGCGLCAALYWYRD
jgi:hypothetical protein